MWMNLLLPDPSDENNNSYPAAYSTAVNPANPAPFFQQVAGRLSQLRQFGMYSQDMGAYLDKTIYNASWVHGHNFKRIMRSVREHRKMACEKHPNDHDIVFVWDINEITMQAKNSLVELQILNSNSKIIFLFMLLTKFLRQTDIEGVDEDVNRNIGNIEDCERDVAHKFRALQQIYNNMKEDNSILSKELLERSGSVNAEAKLRESVEEHQQIFNQRWKTAGKCLKLVNKRTRKNNKKYANIVLCKEGIANGAIQLLTSGNAKEVEFENLYSTWGVSEDSVFERIQKRFGEKCVMIHITSGVEHIGRPFPYWLIRANESIRLLYKLQRDVLLK